MNQHEYPAEAVCRSCGFRGKLGGDILVPVWETLHAYRNHAPDYVGCINCHTMLEDDD